MANKKKEYYKPGPMTEGKRNIIQGLLQEYDIQSAADIQEALNSAMDGQYTVIINTDTSVIDDVIYESTLGGNG